MVIREFVTRDPRTADALRRWVVRAPSPVLRVNSAGVLANVGGGLEDEVVRASLARNASAMATPVSTTAASSIRSRAMTGFPPAGRHS